MYDNFINCLHSSLHGTATDDGSEVVLVRLLACLLLHQVVLLARCGVVPVVSIGFLERRGRGEGRRDGRGEEKGGRKGGRGEGEGGGGGGEEEGMEEGKRKGGGLSERNETKNEFKKIKVYEITKRKCVDGVINRGEQSCNLKNIQIFFNLQHEAI